jgi:hypothetical protein
VIAHGERARQLKAHPLDRGGLVLRQNALYLTAICNELAVPVAS